MVVLAKETVKMFMGVGNPLRGDDGIGPYAALYMEKEVRRRGLEEEWTVINAESVPENYTGVIRRLHPDLLIIFDASDMGLEPGEVRVIPPENVGVMHVSTHAIPLSVFVEIVRENTGRVVLLGVQIDPEKTLLGEEMGPEAKRWAEEVVDTILRRGVESFQSL